LIEILSRGSGSQPEMCHTVLGLAEKLFSELANKAEIIKGWGSVAIVLRDNVILLGGGETNIKD
jgi:hypothetical protein